MKILSNLEYAHLSRGKNGRCEWFLFIHNAQQTFVKTDSLFILPNNFKVLAILIHTLIQQKLCAITISIDISKYIYTIFFKILSNFELLVWVSLNLYVICF